MINVGNVVYVYKDITTEIDIDVIGVVKNIDIDNNEMEISLDPEYTKDYTDDLIRYIPYNSDKWKKL